MKYAKNLRRRARRPVKRAVKKVYRKNRANLRRYGTTRSNIINGPMAQRQIVKMRYSEDINLTASTALQAYDFRANSIYDPNLTGVGHQPLGHDQWNNFYDHYCVLGAKITVRMFHTNNTNTDTVFFSLAMQDTNNSMANQTQIREQPRCKWTQVSPPSAGQSQKILSEKFSSKRFFGAKSVITWDKLSASFGSNPTEDALFRIFYQNSTSVNNVGVAINVTIDYIVLLSEPKVLTQS